MLNTILDKYDISCATMWLTIVDPDNEPISSKDEEPFQIELMSKENPEYRREMHALIEKAQKSKKGKKVDFSLAEAEDLNIKLAAKLSRSWRGLYTTDGIEIPYSFQNACDLYRKYPFVLDQVNEAADVRANFIKSE